MFAAVVILLSAEQFADGLVQTGEQLGISPFFLVQWVAPLASEAPELLVAGLYAAPVLLPTFQLRVVGRSMQVATA